jgi:hypothetical protein
MSDTIDHAREGIEHAHHAHEHGDEAARWIAVLVAVLAAMLAICETGEKTAMVTWLSSHISVSDDYAYYQAKNIRADVLQQEEQTLLSLPTASDPAVQQRIAAIRAQQAHLRDDPHGNGMKQLMAQAEADRKVRERNQHLTHELEMVVGGLQIAIVLASVSVVTRVRWLAWTGFGLGLAMGAWALAVWLG